MSPNRQKVYNSATEEIQFLGRGRWGEAFWTVIGGAIHRGAHLGGDHGIVAGRCVEGLERILPGGWVEPLGVVGGT